MHFLFYLHKEQRSKPGICQVLPKLSGDNDDSDDVDEDDDDVDGDDGDDDEDDDGDDDNDGDNVIVVAADNNIN